MNKEQLIDEVLNETRITKVSEAYTAMRVIWDNIDKIGDMRGLICEGDNRWNTETSKYVKVKYEKLVSLTKEAIRRFERSSKMKKEEEQKKAMWDLWSLSGGKVGVKPSEKEMRKWR